MARRWRRLGEILYEEGLVEKWALVNAINTSIRSDKRLGEILLERGQLNEEALTKCIVQQYSSEYADLDTISISPEALKLIPKQIIKELCIIPFDFSEGTLKLIISDPTDQQMMNTLRFCMNTEMECYLASPTKIREYLNKVFKLDEISEKLSSDPAVPDKHPQCDHQDSKTSDHKDQNTEEVENQAKVQFLGHFIKRMIPFRLIYRVVAILVLPRSKKCRSCWTKNSIPTNYPEKYLPCKKCGRLIKVQPSALRLLLWTAILLIGLTAVFYGNSWQTLWNDSRWLENLVGKFSF